MADASATCEVQLTWLTTPGTENQPNKVPRSAAVSDPLPAWATTAGFSLMDDPPEDGSSPWSSFSCSAGRSSGLLDINHTLLAVIFSFIVLRGRQSAIILPSRDYRQFVEALVRLDTTP